MDKMTPLKILLTIYLTYALILSILATTPINAHNVNHYHKICKTPYTTLYVYTFPVQKICTILEHNGKVVQAQGNSSNSTDGGNWNCNHAYDGAPDLTKGCPKSSNSSNNTDGHGISAPPGKCVDYTCQIDVSQSQTEQYTNVIHTTNNGTNETLMAHQSSQAMSDRQLMKSDPLKYGYVKAY